MKTETPTLSVNGEAAFAYAALAWRILPLYEILEDGTCACGRPDCPEERWGKHPRISSWQIDATTDQQQIRYWWTKWPDANIACATGRGSGLVVIDVDVPEGHAGKADGRDAIEDFAAEFGEMPKTAVVRTGSGGQHYYYQYPDVDGEVSNRTDALPGIDVRGDGGYVLLPPSNHRLGRRYEWI